MDGITDSMDMNLGKLQDVEGQGSLVCYSPWGREESDMTERLNNNRVWGEGNSTKTTLGTRLPVGPLDCLPPRR